MRIVVNIKNRAQSGPDGPPQAKGIENIALDIVVGFGYASLGLMF